ncbi:MAG TPA: hypothetical protein VLF68_02000, partial [Candidatus Saccharimonadales bacterium]|nr:hypothetical protein [Candidatus Saccharimonadales bacterium]
MARKKKMPWVSLGIVGAILLILTLVLVKYTVFKNAQSTPSVDTIPTPSVKNICTDLQKQLLGDWQGKIIPDSTQYTPTFTWKENESTPYFNFNGTTEVVIELNASVQDIYQYYQRSIQPKIIQLGYENDTKNLSAPSYPAYIVSPQAEATYDYFYKKDISLLSVHIGHWSGSDLKPVNAISLTCGQLDNGMLQKLNEVLKSPDFVANLNKAKGVRGLTFMSLRLLGDYGNIVAVDVGSFD